MQAQGALACLHSRMYVGVQTEATPLRVADIANGLTNMAEFIYYRTNPQGEVSSLSPSDLRSVLLRLPPDLPVMMGFEPLLGSSAWEGRMYLENKQSLSFRKSEDHVVKQKPRTVGDLLKMLHAAEYKMITLSFLGPLHAIKVSSGEGGNHVELDHEGIVWSGQASEDLAAVSSASSGART